MNNDVLVDPDFLEFLHTLEFQMEGPLRSMVHDLTRFPVNGTDPVHDELVSALKSWFIGCFVRHLFFGPDGDPLPLHCDRCGEDIEWNVFASLLFNEVLINVSQRF